MAEIVELLLHMFICCAVFSFIVSILFDTDFFRSLRLTVICGLVFIVLKFVTIQRECVQYFCCLNNYSSNHHIAHNRNGNIGRANNSNNNIDDDNNHGYQQIQQRQIKVASALILA